MLLKRTMNITIFTVGPAEECELTAEESGNLMHEFLKVYAAPDGEYNITVDVVDEEIEDAG